MKPKKRKKKGFTLVELLVVIVIISMLAAFVAPNLFRHVLRAKKDLARPKMAIIESALEQFALHCGRFPDDSEGLNALLEPPADLEDKWNGAYLKQSHSPGR